MKFLSDIGIFIGFIFASIGLLVVYMIFSLYQGAKDIVEEANEPVTQTVSIVNNKVDITVPLQKEIGLSYGSLDICRPEDKDMFFNPVSLENASYSCFNNHCVITSDDITSINHAPVSFTVYHKDYKNDCVPKELSSVGHLGITGYDATIEFTEELKNMLHIANDDYKVESDKNSGLTVWKIMGTRKSKFDYHKKVTEDTLIIDDKRVATILLVDKDTN